MMLHLTAPAIVANSSLLLLRVVTGFAFIIASRNKSRNVRKFAKQNMLPLPAGYVVTVLEMLAGITLLIGFIPQLAAAIIMVLMLGTIRLHIFKWKSPYWAASGGWEYDLMLFVMASVVLVQGGGQFVLVG